MLRVFQTCFCVLLFGESVVSINAVLPDFRGISRGKNRTFCIESNLLPEKSRLNTLDFVDVGI